MIDKFASRTVLVVVSALATGGAGADEVQVEITGTVEYNQVTFGPLGNVNPGDDATISFTVDSDVFEDGVGSPTRGYDIDQSSFSLTLGSTTLGLQSPFPPGETPYFALRNDHPAVDGFFVATSPVAPIGVPIDAVGQLGQFEANFSVTYTGDTLDSLDILEAAGTYDFTGLTVFYFVVTDGGFEPIGMIFSEMTITVADPGCTGDLDGNALVDVEDLVTVILDWGCNGRFQPCTGDVNGDLTVNVEDLVAVILQWGACRFR